MNEGTVAIILLVIAFPVCCWLTGWFIDSVIHPPTYLQSHEPEIVPHARPPFDWAEHPEYQDGGNTTVDGRVDILNDPREEL